MRKNAYAFTIVELLIVIVVIAILATISTVAYAGVANRANNSAVTADLANIAKRLQLIHADTGSYPTGGAVTATEGGGSTGHVSYAPQGLRFKVSASSYRQVDPSASGYANFIYCTGPSLDTGVASFGIAAQSSSLANYRYTPSSGLQSVGSASGPTSARACSGIGYPRSISYGYFINSGGWQSWTE